VTLPEVSVDDTDCRAQIDRLLQDEQISLCTRVGDTLLSRHGLSDPFSWIGGCPYVFCQAARAGSAVRGW